MTTRNSGLISGRAALIINECQRGVIEPGGGFSGLVAQVHERGIVPRIADLARNFRKAGLPVMHLPVGHRPDFADVRPNSLLSALARKNRFLIAGSSEAEIVDELKPQPEDFVVARSSGLIGFNGTALDAMLRRMGIATVVLTGVSTNVAMTGCAMAAVDMGYNVVIAEDCIAGSDANVHRIIVQEQLRLIARIASASEVAAALEQV